MQRWGTLLRLNSGGRDDECPEQFRVTNDGSQGAIRRSASGRIPQWAIDEALGKLEESRPVACCPHDRQEGEAVCLPLRRPAPAGTYRWGKRSGTALGVALVVGLYFSPAMFERFVLPTVRPYLPGATMPPQG